MANLFIITFLLISFFKQFQTEHHQYKHYSRHPIDPTVYDNQTIDTNDDDGNMCQLTVRCPAIPTLCK